MRVENMRDVLGEKIVRLARRRKRGVVKWIPMSS